MKGKNFKQSSYINITGELVSEIIVSGKNYLSGMPLRLRFFVWKTYHYTPDAKHFKPCLSFFSMSFNYSVVLKNKQTKKTTSPII